MTFLSSTAFPKAPKMHPVRPKESTVAGNPTSPVGLITEMCANRWLRGRVLTIFFPTVIGEGSVGVSYELLPLKEWKSARPVSPVFSIRNEQNREHPALG